MDDNQELYEAVEEYEAAKDAEDEALRRKTEAQERLAKIMEAQGRKTITIHREGKLPLRATRSSSDYVKSVDEKGLKKALGAKVWKTVTEVKLSQTKLKAAIADGTVDAVTASIFIEVAQKKASITLSNPKEEE